MTSSPGRAVGLHQRRLDAVAMEVAAAGGGRVVDLGCGQGLLVQRLLAEPSVREVVGVDRSSTALTRAGNRLGRCPAPARRQRVRLLQGAITDPDDRLRGFDVAAAVEVVEHLELGEVEAFTKVMFGHIAPAAVIVTTPNRDYNALLHHLSPLGLRHRDHKFEWTRAELTAWVGRAASVHGYRARVVGVGPVHPQLGSPTQMAVFTRRQAA